LLGALLVGCGEEAMYRGIGVTTFRVNGYSEGKVALWSSAVFGLSHGVNLFTSQGKVAFVQVLAAAAAGYFLYLIRRVGGSSSLRCGRSTVDPVGGLTAARLHEGTAQHPDGFSARPIDRPRSFRDDTQRRPHVPG
jgi:Type II CAAX prenyl endopeptidase Rce1-like